MILRFILSSLTFFSSSLVNSTVRNDIRSSITHRWTFNEPFPYKDHVTGQETTLIPRTAQPLKNIDYLNLVGQSCLILGSFTDSCLKNMPGCNSGYSLAFWIKITSNATLPQIFLGTSRNNFSDLQGIFVYQTETIRTERRVIVEFLFDGRSWQVPLKIQQEIWDFIVATWNNTNGRLAAYLNGELVNTSVAGNESDVSKHVKLRGNFPEQVPRVSLYLESGALYDQVKTWNRSLTDYEVKRAFELQMNDLSKIKCTATRTTLNITWQAIERNVFKNGSQGYRLTVWRIPNETKIIKKDLNHSSNHYFLKKLVPYSSYKVRLWDSNIRKRLGGLICGVPSKVRNLTITSQNSTSLSVKWSPPAHKNGILQGYILSRMGERYRVSVTVKGAEKYLATHLMVDTEYEITVQGFTPSGCGAPSRKIAKTNKVPVVRETPKNITAFAVSWHTIEVTWASLDRKEEVTSYEVEYCSFINCSTLQVQDNSAVVKGLTQYTSYNISVRGRNAQNTGPWNSTSVKTLDLDECSDRHRCDELASCINTAGSYECRCKSGLTGNGYRCQVAPTGSPDDDFCKEELFRNITWMRTPKGKTIERHCPYGSSGKAFRTCSAEDNASWQKPDLTQCISKRFEKLRSEMKSGTKDPVSLADELSEITKPADNELVVSGDLHAAVDMLKTLDRKTTKNVTISKEEVDSFMKNVVKVADNLLGGKAMEAWQDSPTKSRSDEASKLLTSIENIALMAASVSNSKNTSNVTTSNVVLRFRSFGKGDSIPKRVTFSTVDDGPGSRIEMPASELPRESNITDLGRINHIAFIYLKNIAQLLTTSRCGTFLSSIKVFSVIFAI